jgi:hypothetical protein
MKQNVLISVEDRHMERMPAVVQELEQAGVEVHETLKSIGTITGAVEEAKVASLRDVDGVAAVEPERQASVPPPDSPIQ